MHWSDPNNIEVLLQEEIRDKKRTARGSFHNIKHRGGGKNGARLKTTVDFLTGKAKKEYTKGGIIVETNMYGELKNCPSLEQLRAIDKTTACNMLKEVKKRNTVTKIREHMKISGYMLYKVFDEFDVPYEHHGTRAEQKKRIEERNKGKNGFLKAPDYVPKEKGKRAYHRKEAKGIQWKPDDFVEQPKVQPAPEPLQQIILEPEAEWETKYNKKSVMGTELQKRILDFMTIVHEDKKYEIKFSLKELADD